MQVQKKKGEVSGESPEQYYWRVFEAKKNQEPWAKDIPCDMTSFRSIHHRCLYCGNPKMEESLSGGECKNCGISRLVSLYSLSDEDAAKMYDNREKRKQDRIRFAEMAWKKKISNTRRSEIEKLPF